MQTPEIKYILYSHGQKSFDKLCSDFTIKLVKRLLSMAVHNFALFQYTELRYSAFPQCAHLSFFHLTNFFLELKIFDLACAKGFVKVPRKRVFTPLSSSLKIATAKLLFLKLNSSMKIPKIIQRIMR